MNGFERRTEQKKESIRRAAMELFQVHGFSKVSIGDIAKKAHVSHVTIYNHFHSKEELIREIIIKIARDVANMAREVIESDQPYPEKIKKLIFNKTNVAAQYQGELVKAIARDYPEIKPVIERLQEEETNALLNKLVEEGKKEKYINPDLSTRSIIYYFMIIRNGVYADRELLESMEIDDKLISDILYLCTFGLIEKQE